MIPPNAGKGRRKGSQNKTTRAFKEATLIVFNKVGGTTEYAVWADKNRTEFYKICARLIPTEVAHSGEIRLPVSIVDELHPD